MFTKRAWFYQAIFTALSQDLLLPPPHGWKSSWMSLWPKFPLPSVSTNIILSTFTVTLVCSVNIGQWQFGLVQQLWLCIWCSWLPICFCICVQSIRDRQCLAHMMHVVKWARMHFHFSPRIYGELRWGFERYPGPLFASESIHLFNINSGTYIFFVFYNWTLGLPLHQILSIFIFWALLKKWACAYWYSPVAGEQTPLLSLTAQQLNYLSTWKHRNGHQ